MNILKVKKLPKSILKKDEKCKYSSEGCSPVIRDKRKQKKKLTFAKKNSFKLFHREEPAVETQEEPLLSTEKQFEFEQTRMIGSCIFWKEEMDLIYLTEKKISQSL